MKLNPFKKAEKPVLTPKDRLSQDTFRNGMFWGMALGLGGATVLVAKSVYAFGDPIGTGTIISTGVVALGLAFLGAWEGRKVFRKWNSLDVIPATPNDRAEITEELALQRPEIVAVIASGKEAD